MSLPSRPHVCEGPASWYSVCRSASAAARTPLSRSETICQHTATSRCQCDIKQLSQHTAEACSNNMGLHPLRAGASLIPERLLGMVSHECGQRLQGPPQPESHTWLRCSPRACGCSWSLSPESRARPPAEQDALAEQRAARLCVGRECDPVQGVLRLQVMPKGQKDAG